MNAKNELQKVSTKNTILSRISVVLYVFGSIDIIVGLIVLGVGLVYSDSWNEMKRLASSSYISLGSESVIFGFCFLFFGAVGKAVNEIRNYTIADFNLRHGLEISGKVKVERSDADVRQQRVETIGSLPVMSEDDGSETSQESMYGLKTGDTVELVSNGALYKVIGFAENDFVQCKPLKKDFIDSISGKSTSFKRSDIVKK